MAKFNLKLRQNRNEADYEADEIVTAEGAPGFTREPRTELFLLGVSNMVGEDASMRALWIGDARFREGPRR